MDSFTAAIISALVSAGFIILNEWVKRTMDHCHKKKKFILWEESFKKKGMAVSEKDTPLLYELLAEQVVEIQIMVGAEGNVIYAYPKGMRPQGTPYSK